MFIHLIPVLKCLGLMYQVVGAAFSSNFSAGYYGSSFSSTQRVIQWFRTVGS